jgi:uncharacterized membrane protein
MDFVILIVLVVLGIVALLVTLFVRWLNKGSEAKISGLDSKIAELEARVNRLEVQQRSSAFAAPKPSESLLQRIEPKPFASASSIAADEVAEVEIAAAKAPADMFEPSIPVSSFPSTSNDFSNKPRDATPSVLDHAKAWLFGGNTVARFGLLILFLGLSFLAKYAVDNDLFPIEARLAVIGIVALGLLVVGWRLRESRPGYGLLLQGGAIAVLYLEIFAGYKLYGLLPGLMTFALMMLVCALATFLSLRQNALVLALVASLGGFLTPILTSTGSGNFVGLFTIYAVLNVGIFAIARYKSWRLLYLAGFVLTFGITSLWAMEKYVPKDFPLAIGFVIFFIVLYSLIPVLEARRAVPNIKHYVDGTLVFGTPTVGFGLLVKLVSHWEFGAAFAALGLGAWYLLVAGLGLKKQVNAAITSQETETSGGAVTGLKSALVSYVALGAGFASLAIPLALDQRLAGIAWAVEGAALIWLGVRASQSLTRLSGVLLQVLGLGIFMSRSTGAVADKPFLNSEWMGATMLAIAMFASAWLYRKWVTDKALASNQVEGSSNRFVAQWESQEWRLSSLFLVIATVLTLFSTSAELASLANGYVDFAILLVFWSAFATIYAWLGVRLKWPLLLTIATLLLPVQVALMLLQWFGFNASFEQWRWAAWPISIGAMFFILRWRVANRLTEKAFVVHALTATLLLAQLMQWSARRFVSDEAWAIAGVGMLISALLLLSCKARQEKLVNLLGHVEQARAYKTLLPRGLAWFVGMWFVFACVSDYGGVAIRPYLPLLNPIDLSAAFAFLCLLAFSRTDSFTVLKIEHKHSQFVLAGAAFLLLNTMLMRALSHYLNLGYSATAMMGSAPAQTSFSLLWAVTATVVMFLASRNSLRIAWLAGAGLLGVVVVKLFLIDLSTISALTRIISFVGVGLLMLLIGYLSPLPPAKSTDKLPENL